MQAMALKKFGAATTRRSPRRSLGGNVGEHRQSHGVDPLLPEPLHLVADTEEELPAVFLVGFRQEATIGGTGAPGIGAETRPVG